jgi:hypothetical protein
MALAQLPERFTATWSRINGQITDYVEMRH